MLDNYIYISNYIMGTLKKLILEQNKIIERTSYYGIDCYSKDDKRNDELNELIRPLRRKILKYIGDKGIKDLPMSDRGKLIELLNSGKMTTEKEVDKEFKKLGGKSESESEEEKPLTKAQKTALIKRIPDWTYTEKQIIKIVDAIREGVITRFSGFPTKSGVKVDVEFVKKSDI